MTADIDRAADLAASFEGFSPTPYRDVVGVWTLGYGSTRDAAGQPVGPDTPAITEEDARALMARTIEGCAAEVARDCKVELSDDQKAALEDFVYNLGAGAFRSSTLLRLLNAGDFAGAAEEFDKWDHAGGRVLAGLLRRREAERKLFTGE